MFGEGVDEMNSQQHASPTVDVDVLVVGSGAAGLAAALAARDAGAERVLIAESQGVVGGSSRLSGGLMMGAGTRFQRELGIDDNADRLYHDYLQLNRWNVEASAVRRLADEAGPARDEVCEHCMP